MRATSRTTRSRACSSSPTPRSRGQAMAPTTKSPPGESQPAAAALTFAAIALAACALAVGVFARLKGLGAAPMAVDEYFIVRSTQNLLKHGWPAFDCGGIYSRGLLLQYPAALLDLL